MLCQVLLVILSDASLLCSLTSQFLAWSLSQEPTFRNAISKNRDSKTFRDMLIAELAAATCHFTTTFDHFIRFSIISYRL